MCSKYRMSNSSNSGKSGLLNQLTGMLSTATNAVKSTVAGNSTNNKNTTKKNNAIKPPSIQRQTAEGSALPVTVGVNAPTTAPNSTAPQTGGVAPLNFRYPANMQQPSERVMQWATTAGMPAPPDMRGVARGGKRSTRKRSSKRRKTHMRKSYKKVKGGKRHSKKHSKKHNKRRSKRHSKRRN
jgi:hypothetical protein